MICNTVDAVHTAGIVHGDLTPSNVLVTASDQIVITDFGFSQHLKRYGDRPAGQPGIASPIGGTLGFAAPEQISPSFGRIGPETDIYAVGGLAYWFFSAILGVSPSRFLLFGASLAHISFCPKK